MKGTIQLDPSERFELQELLRDLEARRQPVDCEDPRWAARVFEKGAYTDAQRNAGRWQELVSKILNLSNGGKCQHD